MGLSFVILLIFGFVEISYCSNISQNLGVKGRYCYQGWVAQDGSDNYQNNKYCGFHPLKYPGCVYIISPSNYIEMGCGNDGGDIPSCYDADVGCWFQGSDYVCCCASDHCNDCPERNCVYPSVPATTTTTTPPPINNQTINQATTTPKSSAGSSLGIQHFGLLVAFVVGYLSMLHKF